MKKIEVSWLCSIYKKTDYSEFKLAINSILNQRGNYMQEIVIVQDGDLDLHANLILSFIEEINKEIRIQLINLRINSGLGIALSKGLKYCNGEFIVRFDTDDINAKDRLIKQLPIIKRNKNIAVIGSFVNEFIPIQNKRLSIRIKKAPPMKFIKRNMNIYNPLNHPTVILRREALGIISYSDMRYFEDYYLWLRLKRNGWDFDNVQEALVFMKVDEFYEKRWGFAYARHELKFIMQIFREKLIPLYFLPIFCLRVISRLIISKKIQKFVRSLTLKDPKTL